MAVLKNSKLDLWLVVSLRKKELIMTRFLLLLPGIPLSESPSLLLHFFIGNFTKWMLRVKTVFLNGEVEQEIYIEQSEGFVIHEKESHVCKLKKALYGLKQALRAWYGRIDSFLQSLGFSKSIAYPNFYIKIVKNHLVILVLYVDDLFLTREEHFIAQIKRELSVEFEMKDLGPMHYFLGLKVWQKPGEIFLSQSRYAFDVLRRFGMLDCKSMTTPMISNLKKLHDQATGSNPKDPSTYRQIIGSLMYLVHTRPNICYAVNALSQFMCEPKHIHMVVVKHILVYV
jgi:hypothetical protein